MRLTVMAVVISGALSSVGAEAPIVARQTLTACYTNCLATANLGGCTLANTVCLCESQPFIQSMASCIDATCSSADIAEARAYSEYICDTVGVSVVNSATVTGSAAKTTAFAATTTGNAATSTSTIQSGANPSSAGDTGGSKSTKSSVPIGAIVGGVVGGVVVLAAIAVTLFFCNRKTSSKVPVRPQFEAKPYDSSYGQPTQSQMQPYPTLPYAPSTYPTNATPSNFSIPPPPLPQPSSNFSIPPSSTQHPALHTQSHFSIPPSSPQHLALHTPSNFSIPPSSPSPQLALYTPQGTSSTVSETNASTTQLVRNNPTMQPPAPLPSHSPSFETRTMESPPPVTRSISPSTAVSNSQLGGEQLVTLQTPYNLDMPTSEIARDMERMRAGQDASEGASRLAGAHAPPAYDIPATEIAADKKGAQRELRASGQGSSGLVRTTVAREPPRYDFKDN